MKPMKINSNLKLSERVVNLEPKHAIYICLIGNYKANDYSMAWQKLWQYIQMSGKFSEEMQKICKDTPKSDAIRTMLCEGKIAHVAIFHDDPKVTENDKQRADVCLTLPFEMEANGEIGAKEIAGGKYLAFLYTGTYEKLSEVYDTIYEKYIPDGGYQIDMRPGFEVYLNDPECTPAEELQTEIYVPIL